jgi:hypothetical protein
VSTLVEVIRLSIQPTKGTRGTTMTSLQLRASQRSVHTIGITEHGVLYIDIQRFSKNRSKDARTFYVLPAHVTRIKRFARSLTMADNDLVRLFAASFHSAEHALEWLRWARVPTIRCHDKGSCCNAESLAGTRLLYRSTLGEPASP